MYFVCFDDKFLNVSLLLQDLKLINLFAAFVTNFFGLGLHFTTTLQIVDSTPSRSSCGTRAKHCSGEFPTCSR